MMHWNPPMHTDNCFPVGSRPGANSDPDTRVQRSKSLFSQVYPLLFIHETERKGGRDSQKERDGEESPSVKPLMWKKKISFLNLPSNGTHMTHPEPARTLPALLLSQCLLVCVRMCCAHTHGFCDVHMCVWERGGEWDNVLPIKLTGGEWTKKILVIAPCCCSIALPEK